MLVDNKMRETVSLTLRGSQTGGEYHMEITRLEWRGSPPAVGAWMGMKLLLGRRAGLGSEVSANGKGG